MIKKDFRIAEIMEQETVEQKPVVLTSKHEASDWF